MFLRRSYAGSVIWRNGGVQAFNLFLKCTKCRHWFCLKMFRLKMSRLGLNSRLLSYVILLILNTLESAIMLKLSSDS
jgi:hypothetical protein